MPEFVFIFLSVFILVPIFYFLGLPSYYLEITFVVLIFILLIPIFKNLFNAPYVPSKNSRVKTMFKLANIKETDRVVELGSGDGRIIRKVADMGVKEAIGYEMSYVLILWAKLAGIFTKNPAKIKCADIMKQDYSDTSVILAYLLPIMMKRVKDNIWDQLPKGARFISNSFSIPGIEPETKEDGVFLYIKK